MVMPSTSLGLILRALHFLSVESPPETSSSIPLEASLFYENQFIEFVTSMPENYNVYGLGERIHGLRLGNNLTATTYAADAGTPLDYNIYGTHPYVRHSKFHGAVLRVYLECILILVTLNSHRTAIGHCSQAMKLTLSRLTNPTPMQFTTEMLMDKR